MKKIAYFLLSIFLLNSNVLFGDLNEHHNRPGVVYWHGDHNKNEIALTFDDGPNEPFTSEVLKILQENNVKATFFLLGKNVEKYPDIAQAIVKAGHAIGNHTYNHPDLIFRTKKRMGLQLDQSERIIEEVTGVKPRLFRPPFGAANKRTFRESEKLGYVAVKWSVSSRDWKRPGVGKIINNVLPHVENGTIILMHDGDKCHKGDRSQTVEALRTLIPELKRRGLQFVTVPELLNIDDKKNTGS